MRSYHNDYEYSQPENIPPKISNWTYWTLGIIVIGVVNIFMWVWFSEQSSSPIKDTIVTEQEVKVGGAKTDNLAKSKHVQRSQAKKIDDTTVEFTFYDDLKKTKLLTGAKPFAKQPHKPYVVQAGSFTTTNAAERELARLKKGGFKLKKVKTVINGTTYYRIQSSIMTDKNVINAKRNALRRYGIEATIIGVAISKLSQQEKIELYGKDTTSLAPKKVVKRNNKPQPKQVTSQQKSKPNSHDQLPKNDKKTSTVSSIDSISLGAYSTEEQLIILDLLSEAGIDAIKFKNVGAKREIIVTPINDYNSIKERLTAVGFTITEH